MQHPKSMQTTKLNVSGMTCGACVGHVTRALSSVPGVDKVDVSLSENIADVKFDEARVSMATLRTAIQSAGYDVATTPVKRTSGGCCGS